MTDRKETDSEERARLRAASRLAAVQALYQMDLSGRGAKAVADEFLEVRFREEGAERPIVEADEDLFSDILSGVVATQAEIDAAVQSALAKGWTLPRLDATVRAILRCGAYELMKRPDVPARVVIDQYVDVAHAFFEGPEPGFVNAALDSCARKVRADELKAK